MLGDDEYGCLTYTNRGLPMNIPLSLEKLSDLCYGYEEDMARFNGTCHVKIESTMDGWEFTATDGRVLAMITLPYSEAAPKVATSQLASPAEWGILFHNAIARKQSAVTVDSIPAVADKKFPDCSKIFPTKEPLCKARFDPNLLIKLLTLAADLFPDGMPTVDLTFYPDTGAKYESPVRLDCVGDRGEKMVGLIVPLAKKE
jgi:hypothetical protein